jgi:arginine-tRNA-protein transferase
VERVKGSPRFVDTPAERLVYDELTRCPYLPGQTARLPMRLPSRRLTREELSRRLHGGDRREGVLLYHPRCPTCCACEPLRIDVEEFVADKTQRRILRRGDLLLETKVGRPTVTLDRVVLYNRHKVGRGLLFGNDLIDSNGYVQFLVETCVDSVEIAYRLNGKLLGVAVADRATEALSAVYCYYDPRHARLSPGVYSILKQIQLCRDWGLRYLYLGLYVAGSRTMEYKRRYLPHERLINGAWRRFEGTGDR